MPVLPAVKVHLWTKTVLILHLYIPPLVFLLTSQVQGAIAMLQLIVQALV